MVDEGAQAEDVHTEVGDVEMSPAEMEAKGHYEVKGILKHKFRQGAWRFLVWWSPPYTVNDATWEPLESFVVGPGVDNEHLERYCQEQGLQSALDDVRGKARSATASHGESRM
jgi:hypothetical protein